MHHVSTSLVFKNKDILVLVTYPINKVSFRQQSHNLTIYQSIKSIYKDGIRNLYQYYISILDIEEFYLHLLKNVFHFPLCMVFMIHIFD